MPRGRPHGKRTHTRITNNNNNNAMAKVKVKDLLQELGVWNVDYQTDMEVEESELIDSYLPIGDIEEQKLSGVQVMDISGVGIVDTYKDGLRDGVSETFSLDGDIVKRRRYKKGELHGPEETFSPGGKFTIIRVYEDGELTGETKVKYLDAPYLYVNKAGQISYGYFTEDFHKDKGTEMYIDEILTLKPKRSQFENQFNPFEKVLVRDCTQRKWEIEFYSYYDEISDKKYNLPHVCHGGHYKYCIPYKGDEYLLGTTDEPEEYT